MPRKDVLENTWFWSTTQETLSEFIDAQYERYRAVCRTLGREETNFSVWIES